MTALVVEVAALVALGVLGWLVAPRRHGDTWRLAVAVPLGVAAFTCVELVLVATGLPVARPWIALPVALTIALAGAVRRARSRDTAPTAGGRATRAPTAPVAVPGWRLSLVGIVAVVAVTLLTAVLPLVNVTADSFRYLTTANLLAATGDTSGMSGFLLLSRSLVVGAVHGLAAADPGYLRAVGPLVALSTIAMLWLLVREGTGRLDPRLTRWLAAAAALLLATNHRFIFNAFYLNGHLLFAAWLLLMAAVCWRVLQASEQADVVSGTTVAVLAVATTVLRPEGALVVALVLLPVLVAPTVPRRWRQSVLVAFGAGNVLWHLVVVARSYLPGGDWGELGSVPVSVLGMVALGGATIAAALLLPVLDGRMGRRPLVVIHGLAWLAVIGLALRSPGILYDSAEATARNVIWDGLWGSSLLVLAGLLVIAVAVRRVQAEEALLFPLLTFVPLGILLAFLRDGAYRVGPGDSLNRMLLHVLPLAVLGLALTADGERRTWHRSPSTSQAT